MFVCLIDDFTQPFLERIEVIYHRGHIELIKWKIKIKEREEEDLRLNNLLYLDLNFLVTWQKNVRKIRYRVLVIRKQEENQLHNDNEILPGSRF